MAMNLSPVLRQRFFDANGNPLAGGKLYTYQAGTTTPQATYTDSSGVTPSTNPIVLDVNGECSLWIDPSLSYKFVLTDASDAVQWTVDNVIGLVTANAVVAASIQDGAITTSKIADGAVTSAKLSTSATVDAVRAVTTNSIKDLAVTTPKLNDLAVTTAKINDLGVTTAKIQDGAVTQIKMAPVTSGTSVTAGNIAISGNSGPSQVFSSTTPADVNNLSVTITTTGRPVMISVQGDGAAVIWNGTTGGTSVNILRDGALLASHLYNSGASNPNYGVSLNHLDLPPIGSHTYSVQCKVSSGSTGGVWGARLIAFEL